VPQPVRWRIFAYLGVLIVLMGFGAPAGGLIGLPISFFLKNKLHLEAHQTAIFHLFTGIPVYLSFLFGFARDTFSPLGMRDRGFMVLFGSICSGIYLAFAFAPLTYGTLLTAVPLLHTAFLFVSSAQSGLTATIGQQQLMSGQVSTTWNVFGTFPGLAALLLGGILSDALEHRGASQAARILFLLGAVLTAAIALYALWRPASVYDHIRIEPRPGVDPWEDIKRLLRHWPIYPALAIWLLWNFAPGSVTPLQYYLQNTLHANDAEWGEWNAIFSVSFVPSFMVFASYAGATR
jgi:MFS family permease